MEFSFSVNVQNLPINSHGKLMSLTTIWISAGQNGGDNWDVGHQNGKCHFDGTGTVSCD
jgi:hypothetical protein